MNYSYTDILNLLDGRKTANLYNDTVVSLDGENDNEVITVSVKGLQTMKLFPDGSFLLDFYNQSSSLLKRRIDSVLPVDFYLVKDLDNPAFCTYALVSKSLKKRVLFNRRIGIISDEVNKKYNLFSWGAGQMCSQKKVIKK